MEAIIALSSHSKMTCQVVSVLVLLVAISFANGQDPVECTHPYIEVGGRCLYIDPWVKGNMHTIRDMCKYHGGDLLWLDNTYDCDFYGALINHLHDNNLNMHDYWIGITDQGHEGTWKYVKNNGAVRMGAPYWVQGNPTDVEGENCAIMYKNKSYYWVDVKCDAEYNGICRSNKT